MEVFHVGGSVSRSAMCAFQPGKSQPLWRVKTEGAEQAATTLRTSASPAASMTPGTRTIGGEQAMEFTSVDATYVLNTLVRWERVTKTTHSSMKSIV
jgi:hypothetical protein